MLAVSGLNKNNFSGVGVQWGGPKRSIENFSWGMRCNGTKKNKTRGTRRQGRVCLTWAIIAYLYANGKPPAEGKCQQPRRGKKR